MCWLRVTARNAQVRRYCNAKTSLVNVFHFFGQAIEKNSDRAALRDAQLRLPTVASYKVSPYWFGDMTMEPLKFALGTGPFRFTQDGMEISSSLGSSPENTVFDGPEREEALGQVA